MITPGRKFSAGSGYRYGFNGKENDKDISAGAQDYGMRIYDTRTAKFLSTDPLSRKYPQLTPYSFASNTPIQAVDMDGLEAITAITIGEEQVWGKAFVDKLKKEGAHMYNIPVNKPGDGNSQDLKRTLIRATFDNSQPVYHNSSQEIAFLALFTHGSNNISHRGKAGIFANVKANPTAGNIYQSDLNGLTSLLGLIPVIRFSPGAKIYLGGCNCGTPAAGQIESFAQTLANETGVPVLAATNSHMGAFNTKDKNNTKFFPSDGGNSALYQYMPNSTPILIGIRREGTIDVADLAKKTYDEVKKLKAHEKGVNENQPSKTTSTNSNGQ